MHESLQTIYNFFYSRNISHRYFMRFLHHSSHLFVLFLFLTLCNCRPILGVSKTIISTLRFGLSVPVSNLRKKTSSLIINTCLYVPAIQGGPKSKPPNDQKMHVILLKPVNEIRFIRQIKVRIKH